MYIGLTGGGGWEQRFEKHWANTVKQYHSTNHSTTYSTPVQTTVPDSTHSLVME